jgi:uncharacterized protein
MASGSLALGPAIWRMLLEPASASARVPRIGAGPYGPLQPADLNGIMLPKGFRAREIARGGQPVGLTGYPWHLFSDGSASMRQSDGGWIFAANSELPGGQGGASAIRFRSDGSIADAYRILEGTDTNCGGGLTPWGTWLSGEEVSGGRVWECDIYGKKQAVPRPALGVFSHEYVVAHAAERRFYQTEDESGGGFYRFTPKRWGDLSEGLLEIATLRKDGFVEWRRVPDPLARAGPVRDQVKEASHLRRPEGLCVDSRTGIVYLVESSAGRVFAYDSADETYERVYAEQDYRDPILTDPDNAVVSPISGDLFVCEDAGDLDICMITPEGELARFLHLSGAQHGDPTTDATSETTGPSFDPSGTRLYFSSQRAYVAGAVYEITGPWRRKAAQLPRRPAARPGRLRLDAVAPSSTKRSTLARNGLPVSVALSRTADIRLILETRAAGAGAARTRRITLGQRERKRVRAGRTGLIVRPSSRGRSYLASRSKPLDALLVVTATRPGLKTVRVSRRVRIVPDG